MDDLIRLDDQNRVMTKDNPSLTDVPSDTIPPVDRGDVTNLDEDHLRSYILSAFRNMIADKQDYGWLQKKDYALKSYYGEKNEAMKNWPWKGASAFPVPLTPTITDTAWANVQASIWSNPNGPILVPGIGDEDVRTAKFLERFQNWQMMNEDEINFEMECDKHVFRTFLHGTGITKTMYDLRTNTIKIYSIDLENFYVPIDAQGLQKDGTDIIIQIIPLSYNDIQQRKAMGIYRDAEAIVPGIGIARHDPETLRTTMDKISGVSLDQKVRRENYYIAETHLTYIPPGSMRPRDLIVWMSPNGGVIQRIREKKDGKRPFEDAHAYPYADRFYSIGIPEKIKNCQEKVDYADKQYTDGLDIANRPAAFVDDTSDFDRTRMQRVPGGIYPKGKGNTVDFEPQPPVERGFAQERALIWEMAERLTGVIDITQGRPSAYGGKTLGEIEIRASRADVRFSAVFKRFGKWWKQVVTHQYELNHEHTPKEKVMDVLGYSSEGYSINEIFPVKNGKLVNYNFQFSGQLIGDQEDERNRKYQFYVAQLQTPWVMENPANWWRTMKEMADVSGVRNVESVYPKPEEADLISVQEFIKRVVSGQRDVQIRPGIETDRYIFELKLFMDTGTFQNLDEWQQQIIFDALRRAITMSVAERKAAMAAMRQKLMMSAQAMPQRNGEPTNAVA